jgi:arylsulfatase
MTGKWHVGTPPDKWPRQRGFERFYGSESGGFYFRPFEGRKVISDDTVLYTAQNPPPDGWYSTDAWTDNGIKFIDEALAAKKPFFLYLAHNAPHFPLQAPPEDIAKFRGKYKIGWDKLREQRHAKQIQLGIVDKAWPMSPRPEEVKAWEQLTPEQQDRFDHIMAIYAACVEHMDRSVGRLVDALKQRGVLDNTLILFLSDNGGNAESGPNGRLEGSGVLGSADSTVYCGQSWATLENTPLRRYKHFNHEGGISTPLIAHWPARIKDAGQLRQQPGHLVDLMATCVDVSGAKYPTEFKGKPIEPMEGRSLVPAFDNKRIQRDDALYWEHEGNAAVREGDWKLVRLGYEGRWELYNLKSDRTEQHDLAGTQPDKAKALAAKWDAWATRANVKPWPGGTESPNTPANNSGGKKKKKAATERTVSNATHFELGPDADLRDAQAPDIANRGFELVVNIVKPGDAGVLVAQGGSKAGWVLFFEKGQLHFVVSRAGIRSGLASADVALATAKQISASLAADGAVKLSADGRGLAEGKVPGLLPNQPVDGLQVGRDLAGNVGEYAGPFAFNGTISSVIVELHPR